MKRIYLVGTSDDNKRLQLAQGKGARFGSMELPISPKLRAILREVDAERLAKLGKKLPEEELKDEKARARKAEAEADRSRDGLESAGKSAREAEKRAAQAERRAQEAEKQATEARRRAEEAEKKAAATEKRAEEAADRVREAGVKPDGGPAKGGLAPGGFERATGVNGMEGVHAIIRPAPEVGGPKIPARERASARANAETLPEDAPEKPEKEAPRRKKAQSVPEPKLTPAQIQTLLRSGRGIRSVARQAETPVDWVRRLAAPIESERLGVVTQLMQSYVVRARLGRSALPVGPSIVENLRDRGLGFPERVAEDGWTAWRPDNREWRVRFTYESRGRKQRADWYFEPQSRTVTPQNDLAQELAFRSAADGDGVGGAGAAPRWKAASAKRASSRKTSTKRSAMKRASRKRSAAR